LVVTQAGEVAVVGPVEELAARIGALAGEHVALVVAVEVHLETFAGCVRRGLKNALSPDQQLTKAALAHLDIGKQTAADTTMELGDLDQLETIIARALDLLQAGKARAYDKALSALSEDTRERWDELIKRKPALGLLMFDDAESRYTANADGLIEFLQKEGDALIQIPTRGTGESAADPRTGLWRGSRRR
jgi:hypothetical protein